MLWLTARHDGRDDVVALPIDGWMVGRRADHYIQELPVASPFSTPN